MESLNEQDLAQENPTEIFYTAVGWVAGTFQPGEKKFQHGVLVTQDGQKISASLDWYLYHQLKKLQKDPLKPADALQKVYRWKVYPRTQPLRFDLVQMKPLRSTNNSGSGKRGQENQRKLDEFRVVGEIKAMLERKVIICIQRNQQSRFEKDNPCQHQPLTLTLNGSLPTAAIGQIWDLQVRRSGEKLVIATGIVYEPSAEDLVSLKNKRQTKVSQSGEEVNQSIAPHSDAEAAPYMVSASKSDQKAATTTTVQKQQLDQLTQKLMLPSSATPTISLKALPPSVSVPTKPREKSISQKGAQPKTSSPVTKPQSQKPAFQVKVNGQVFKGYNSVTLNNRMLCIDGKPVAQAKMAIVVGQPITMQADTGVTRSGDQAVLISR